MSFLHSSTALHEPRTSKTVPDLRAAARCGTDRPESREGILSPLVRLLKDPAAIVGDAMEGFRDGRTAEERTLKISLDRQRQIHEARLRSAITYEDWRTAAIELDVLEQNEAWKADSSSTYFDAALVEARLKQLDEARVNCDVTRMLFLIRTSLMRGLGDMGNIRLYKHSHIGTKYLIERYIDSALETLDALLSISAKQANPTLEAKDMLDQILSARQAFGRSALLLSGGATFGMSHVGVLKALWEAKLLPRIISGASAGSIVSAVVCTRTDEEIPELLDRFPHGDLSVFDKDGDEDGVLRRVARFLKIGAWIDISHLTRVMKNLLGDMTFQEAYNRTRRILNICVSSASVYELPRLLNYVTAPNVLIWSAVAASCSVPFVFSAASLLAKDPRTGVPIPWNPSPQRWIDGSVDNDLPMTRLAEMFNVNHFIVSQVNPHVVPFLAKEEERLRVECQDDRLGSSWLYALGTLAKDEALHRMHVLTELGIFPNTLTKARSVLSQKYSGDITIFPEISYSDFPRMLNNPTTAFMLQACVSGEKATWPKLSRIRNHCALELALDDAVKHLRDRVVFSPSQIDLRLSSFNGNHPQRSHVSIRGRGRRERNMSQSSDPNQPVQAMSGKPLSSDTRPVRFRHAKAKSTGSKLMLSPTTHRPPPSFPPRPTVHVPSESSASSSPLHHPTDVGGSTTQTPQCSSDGDDDLTTDEAFSSETESGRSSPLLSIPTGPPLFPFASQPTTPHGHRRFSFLTPLVSHTTSHSDKSEHASGTITPVNPSTSPGLGLDLSMTTSASELKRHGYVPQADSSIQGSASQAGHGASSHRLGLIASLSVLDRV